MVSKNYKKLHTHYFCTIRASEPLIVKLAEKKVAIQNYPGTLQ